MSIKDRFVLPAILRPAQGCCILHPNALAANNDACRVHGILKLALVRRRVKDIDSGRRLHNRRIPFKDGMQKARNFLCGHVVFIMLLRPSATRRSESLSIATLYGGSVTTRAALAPSINRATSSGSVASPQTNRCGPICKTSLRCVSGSLMLSNAFPTSKSSSTTGSSISGTSGRAADKVLDLLLVESGQIEICACLLQFVQ